MLVMDQNIEQQNKANKRDQKIQTDINSGEKSNLCNQCDYTSSHASNLRSHMKTHSGDKSKKCNQCNYASSQASNLRTHLKTHGGDKSNIFNQCDYASSQVSNLRSHIYENTQWTKVEQMQPV